jgi:ABC-type sugar transport system permease subunit
MGYFRILAAIPGFFLSSFLLMLIWGWLITPEFGLATVSYVQSMLVTVTLWIAVAPLAAVGKGHHH